MKDVGSWGVTSGWAVLPKVRVLPELTIGLSSEPGLPPFSRNLPNGKIVDSRLPFTLE
jgi:hypothetical protein